MYEDHDDISLYWHRNICTTQGNMSNNSKSDDFLNNRQGSPVVSPQMARSVSNVRRSMLEEEVQAGLFRESAHSSGRMQKTGAGDYGPSPAGFVLSNGKTKQIKLKPL